jgi:hypothetical protein
MDRKCNLHDTLAKIKKAFSFSRIQWAVIAIFGLVLLAYLGHHRDKGIKAERVRMEKIQNQTGGIPGCAEATKQRNGSFKCAECEDGYLLKKGKCVERK